ASAARTRVARAAGGRRGRRLDDDADPRVVESEGKAGARLAAPLEQLARGLPARADGSDRTADDRRLAVLRCRRGFGRARFGNPSAMTADSNPDGRSAHRVVVIGGGFGGLQAVRKLRRAPVEVTLIDRRNFHLFQPLTYQVATGALSAGEIAYPLRAIFKRYANVRVLMAEVADFDLDARKLHLRSAFGIPTPATIPYDTLIVAGGSHYSYFGHDEWREHAAEVKSLESALVVRTRLLSAFEAAEGETDPEHRAAWLTFVVVGAGPTGVEMAGQIA